MDIQPAIGRSVPTRHSVGARSAVATLGGPRGDSVGNGVIGNTAVSGTVIQGSSPCSPAQTTATEAGHRAGLSSFSVARAADPVGPFACLLVVCWGYSAPSSSGLGHHPLKVAARVRIPLGLLRKVQVRGLASSPRQGQDPRITPDLHPPRRAKSPTTDLPRREGRMKGTIRVRENRDGSKSYVCQVKLGRDPGTGRPAC